MSVLTSALIDAVLADDSCLQSPSSLTREAARCCLLQLDRLLAALSEPVSPTASSRSALERLVLSPKLANLVVLSNNTFAATLARKIVFLLLTNPDLHQSNLQRVLYLRRTFASVLARLNWNALMLFHDLLKHYRTRYATASSTSDDDADDEDDADSDERGDDDDGDSSPSMLAGRGVLSRAANALGRNDFFILLNCLGESSRLSPGSGPGARSPLIEVLRSSTESHVLVPCVGVLIDLLKSHRIAAALGDSFRLPLQLCLSMITESMSTIIALFAHNKPALSRKVAELLYRWSRLAPRQQLAGFVSLLVQSHLPFPSREDSEPEATAFRSWFFEESRCRSYTEFVFDLGSIYDKESLKQFVMLLIGILAPDTDAGGDGAHPCLCQNSSSHSILLLSTLRQRYPAMLESPQLAKWLFSLMDDNDCQLIQVLLDLQALSSLVRLCCRRSTSDPISWLVDLLDTRLHPLLMFSTFCESVAHDESVLLDFLISDETAFLEYLLAFLKLDLSVRSSKVSSDLSLGVDYGDDTDDARSSKERRQMPIDSERLSMLRDTIANLHQTVTSLCRRGLFPYDAGSLTRRMEQWIDR
ncbi:uncharacterized protein BJ171DRAFT_594820 [Polychytrium aggregatum]|uniref:uncharacterized protein n=1 Tax=Polychytrium aggregatum TaxID=110093 RepID=UPI0022FF3523|nr:uncharacterized protein BJ171DRAFT_594820 [Polychytrium aggregatum]KAI9209804.1 hypothetical protein BJ171DRAFT_594820 [Polychytrium aggregatum]